MVDGVWRSRTPSVSGLLPALPENFDTPENTFRGVGKHIGGGVLTRGGSGLDGDGHNHLVVGGGGCTQTL